MLKCTRKNLQYYFNLLLEIFYMVYIALFYFCIVYLVWCYVVFVLWHVIIFQGNIRMLHKYEVSVKMVKLGKYVIIWHNHLICFYHCCFSYEVMSLFFILEKKFWEVQVEKTLLMPVQYWNDISEECEIQVQCHHFTDQNQIAQISETLVIDCLFHTLSLQSGYKITSM